MNQSWIRFFIVFCFVISASLHAEIRGKVDLGAALLSIDMLQSGKTQKTLRMNGIKADATILIYKGLAIKPNIIWAQGGDHGRITTGGVAVGFYVPINDKFKILPNVGMSWSNFYARVVMDPFGPHHVREKFRSKSPYVGLDASYQITPSWSLIATYQYAWSSTYTSIKPFVKNDKSHSEGPNYGAAMEYAFNDQLAVNFGVGYNLTVSKEKHGLRGKGMKLGLAYYF